MDTLCIYWTNTGLSGLQAFGKCVGNEGAIFLSQRGERAKRFAAEGEKGRKWDCVVVHHLKRNPSDSGVCLCLADCFGISLPALFQNTTIQSKITLLI